MGTKKYGSGRWLGKHLKLDDIPYSNKSKGENAAPPPEVLEGEESPVAEESIPETRPSKPPTKPGKRVGDRNNIPEPFKSEVIKLEEKLGNLPPTVRSDVDALYDLFVTRIKFLDDEWKTDEMKARWKRELAYRLSESRFEEMQEVINYTFDNDWWNKGITLYWASDKKTGNTYRDPMEKFFKTFPTIARGYFAMKTSKDYVKKNKKADLEYTKDNYLEWTEAVKQLENEEAESAEAAKDE